MQSTSSKCVIDTVCIFFLLGYHLIVQLKTNTNIIHRCTKAFWSNSKDAKRSSKVRKIPLPLDSMQSDECISYWDPPKYEVSPPCLRVCLWASFKRDIAPGLKSRLPLLFKPLICLESWETFLEAVNDERINHAIQTDFVRIRIQSTAYPRKSVFTSQTGSKCPETTVQGESRV